MDKLEEEKKGGFPEIGFRIIILLISIPAAMILGRWLPQIIVPIGEDGFDIHILVALIISSFALQILLYPLRKVLSVIGIAGLVVLGIMFYRKDISKDQVKDYFWTTVAEITNRDYVGKSIDHQTSIDAAIAENEGIEAFVDAAKSKYSHYTCFSEPILTSFALFDEISCQWKYKYDPEYRELFRPVAETIRTNTGDCDDHAICLAACMKEAGARSRIVHMDGHLYPELYIGQARKKNEILKDLRKIYPNARTKTIYMNNDNGELWISMDYTAKYPGGKNIGNYTLETYELN